MVIARSAVSTFTTSGTAGDGVSTNPHPSLASYLGAPPVAVAMASSFALAFAFGAAFFFTAAFASFAAF